MKRICILLAGGSSTRFGGKIPKQFELLAGKPVLFYSIEKFSRLAAEIVLVLPAMHFSYWNELCSEHRMEIPHTMVEGGDTRTRSVAQGLAMIQGPGYVAIHDGARPLTGTGLIDLAFETAEREGCAVPALEVRQALRRLALNHSEAVDRTSYRLVQTPQCFDISKLKSAYDRFGHDAFDDDAALYEKAGHRIVLIPGEQTNIKITTPADLQVAETFMRQSAV